jgi:hypothetical protein
MGGLYIDFHHASYLPLAAKRHRLESTFSGHQNLEQLKSDVLFSEGKVPVSFPTLCRRHPTSINKIKLKN